MRICLINNIQSTGSAFYRLELPHAYLNHNYSGMTFWTTSDANLILESDFENFDIVIVSRMWGYTDAERNRLRLMCTKYNCKLILDLDDYWVLESGHPMVGTYREHDMSNKIRAHIQDADHVICTNDYLKSKVELVGQPNVTVIPNCHYDNYEQYKRKPTQSDRVRFGWFGGAQHYEDVILMEDSMLILAADKSVDGKHMIYCGGWNDNPMYHAYDWIFSGHGKSNNYSRINAANIYSYVGGYNFVDVCLAPLRNTTFNRCKSELKIVEAGAMGKPIICSDVYPYNTVIQHGVNGLLVKEERKRDWHKEIKRLINDNELRESLATNLEKTVAEKFDIRQWSAVRYELYKSLL